MIATKTAAALAVGDVLVENRLGNKHKEKISGRVIEIREAVNGDCGLYGAIAPLGEYRMMIRTTAGKWVALKTLPLRIHVEDEW